MQFIAKPVIGISLLLCLLILVLGSHWQSALKNDTPHYKNSVSASISSAVSSVARGEDFKDDWMFQSHKLKPSNGTGRVPDFIGIGIRKCGTGVYMNFLKKHGSFRFPKWKNEELEYFTRRKHFGLEWYKKRFEPTPTEQFAIEKTPHYFYAAPASIPEDMIKLNPKMKVFLLLCDPTPRAYSCFVHHNRAVWQKKGVASFENYVKQTLPGLQSALAKLNESKPQENYLLGKWRQKEECLLAGLYSVHMERWRKSFNESQMLVIDGEAVMRDPGPQYEKMQDFFGVPRNIRVQDWVKHNTTGHYCLRPPEDRASLYCQDNEIKKARTRSYNAKKPSKMTTDALKAFYKPYNEKLYKLLGNNFHWI